MAFSIQIMIAMVASIAVNICCLFLGYHLGKSHNKPAPVKVTTVCQNKKCKKGNVSPPPNCS